MHKVTVERQLKYTFTREEREQMATELVNCHYDRAELEDQLSSIKKDYGGRIGSIETQIEKFSRRIRDGYEMREITCECRFHDPEPGKKTIVRLDTNEVVSVEFMLPHERQEILPFQPEQADESPEPSYPVPDEQGFYPMERAQALRKDFGDGEHVTIYLLEVEPDQFKGTYVVELAGSTIGFMTISEDDETMSRQDCLDQQLHELIDWLDDLKKSAQREKPSAQITKRLEKIDTALRIIENYRRLVAGPQPDAQLEDVTDGRQWPQPNQNGVYEPVGAPAFEWDSKGKKTRMHVVVHTLEVGPGVWISALSAEFKDGGLHEPLMRREESTYTSEQLALANRLEHALRMAAKQKSSKEIWDFEEKATATLNFIRGEDANEDVVQDGAEDSPEVDEADQPDE